MLTLNFFSFKSFATIGMKWRQVWNKARHGQLRFVHHAIKFARERGSLPQKLPGSACSFADSLVDDHPCRLCMFMTCDRCAFLLHLDDDELLYPEVRRGNSSRSRDTDGSPCQVLTPMAHSPARAACLSSFGQNDSHMVCLSGYIVWICHCLWCVHGETAMSQLTFPKQPCSWTVRHTISCCISAYLNLTGGRRHPCTLWEALEEFQKAHILFSACYCVWVNSSV